MRPGHLPGLVVAHGENILIIVHASRGYMGEIRQQSGRKFANKIRGTLQVEVIWENRNDSMASGVFRMGQIRKSRRDRGGPRVTQVGPLLR
jgi:hypothetical protein